VRSVHRGAKRFGDLAVAYLLIRLRTKAAAGGIAVRAATVALPVGRFGRWAALAFRASLKGATPKTIMLRSSLAASGPVVQMGRHRSGSVRDQLPSGGQSHAKLEKTIAANPTARGPDHYIPAHTGRFIPEVAARTVEHP
jgi:hypothetical protein